MGRHDHSQRADSNAFPEQINEVGLKPWHVDRLAVRAPDGTLALNPKQLLPHAGMLMEDLTAISRAMIWQSTISTERPSYRVTHLATSNPMKASDLLSGIQGIPSRKTNNTMHRNLAMFQELTAKHKRFAEFNAFEANNQNDLRIWNQKIQAFAMKLDRQIAGIWLMQISEQYLRSGKTELAANANRLLVTRWPNHAFAPSATIWLAQYYASDEFAQIEFMTRIKNNQLATTETVEKSIETESSFSLSPRMYEHNGDSRLVWLPTNLVDESKTASSNVQLALATETNGPMRPPFFDERTRVAARYLSQLGQRDPDLAVSPQSRLLEAQISRQLNGIFANKTKFENLARLRDASGDGVSLAARRELSLNESSPSASRVETLTCQFTYSRPTLDGKLDEPFWQSARQRAGALRMQTQVPGSTENIAENARLHQPDVALMAYDDKFLYAGFTCQKIEGQYYNQRKQSRPRDADLTRRDRIELSLDINRDYRSALRFVVDCRGWVWEDCGGSLGWNPTWYVSQSETNSTWTVEFAIPLDQLIPGQIESDSTWAVQIARRAYSGRDLWSDPSKPHIRPVHGFLSGLVSRPNRFELIRFENKPSETKQVDHTATLNAPLMPIR